MKLFVIFFCFMAVCSASKISLQQPNRLQNDIVEKLLQQIASFGNEADELITVNINKHVDEIMKLIPVWIVKNGFDPRPVDDIIEGFSMKIGLITWHGEFTLTKGWMQGLSTILRSGDAFMNYEAELLNIRLPLTFDIVNINYDYLVKIMNIGPTGGVEGKIKDLNIFVDITIDTKTLEIVLQGFEITDSGRITVHFSGNPLVDWLTNVITGLATRLLHEVAENVVENQVRELLENTINNINNALHPNNNFINY